MKNGTDFENNFFSEGIFSHASLFSGIGGFDLAASWMGWQNIFQVEIDKFCQKVLEKNFPDTKRYSDIKNFNGTEYENKIDILTGGFPCQPFSVAGKQQRRNDERFLWNEMLRVITKIKPKFVIAENVPGIVKMELGQMCASLENEGYEVQPFIIPACAVNAPHKRERVWIVAYSGRYGLQRGEQGMFPAQEQGYAAENLSASELRECWKGNNIPPPRICRSGDGLPDRVDRIKALGNAIVPQIAFEVFCLLEAWEKIYFQNHLTKKLSYEKQM